MLCEACWTMFRPHPDSLGFHQRSLWSTLVVTELRYCASEGYTLSNCEYQSESARASHAAPPPYRAPRRRYPEPSKVKSPEPLLPPSVVPELYPTSVNVLLAPPGID